jgi:hypothetical protein
MSSLVYSRPRKLSTMDFLALTIQAAASIKKDRSLPGLRRSALLTGQVASSAPEPKRDTQIVNEFRTKLRLADEMITKLAFSLREIQGLWSDPADQSTNNVYGKLADITPIAAAAEGHGRGSGRPERKP